MALCPDFSESDDSAMSDDGDYNNFKNQVKNVIKSPIKTEEDTKKEQINSLFSALSSGNIDSVIELLNAGIDVNVCMDREWRPIHLAASYGNPDLTRELIKRGADVSLTREMRSPLIMACNCPNTTSPFEKSLEVIKLLVEAGADVLDRDGKRMSALMMAAYNGNLEAVRYLTPLSNKHAEDNQNWTALFWAVNSNQPAVVQYFLDEELDYTKVDIRGNTPLDIAKRFDFHEVAKLFPEEPLVVITDLMDLNSCNFEEIFSDLKKGEKPKFFLDICSILCGVRAEPVIQNVAEKNITLYDFLSISDDELKDLGVQLPHQRNRILGGLYRFHKQPFHPKSVHAVPLTENYSTVDMAVQLLLAVKQTIALEASLAFMIKHYKEPIESKHQLPLMAKNLHILKKKMYFVLWTAEKYKKKIKMLDNEVKPADLITSRTKTYFLPWRKIIFSVSALSLVLAIKIMK